MAYLRSLTKLVTKLWLEPKLSYLQMYSFYQASQLLYYENFIQESTPFSYRRGQVNRLIGSGYS